MGHTAEIAGTGQDGATTTHFNSDGSDTSVLMGQGGAVSTDLPMGCTEPAAPQCSITPLGSAIAAWGDHAMTLLLPRTSCFCFAGKIPGLLFSSQSGIGTNSFEISFSVSFPPLFLSFSHDFMT